MERRTNAPWAAGCSTLLAGALAGYGAHRLSRAARRTCAVIAREHPSLFDLWTWQAPLTVLAGAFAGLLAWALPATALRHRESRPLTVLIPSAVLLVTLIALTLVHFAWLGTPLAVGNDTNGVCPPDNVPPW
ncbi:hypothetical protein [Streptomyces sp. Amel2xC10]|uniref:hypothetical protein n=1 Tax=Streptomyces sp. Amel2xC10 TaxID=1305826 RepID=UPI000A08DAB0|nr:hypothetical protein [Streptomyces sp. Amel2xC10]SMF43549.1 hypothetical protein SAMN02745830_03430 [Streptomyces sp. Amel2xC10]